MTFKIHKLQIELEPADIRQALIDYTRKRLGLSFSDDHVFLNHLSINEACLEIVAKTTCPKGVENCACLTNWGKTSGHV